MHTTLLLSVRYNVHRLSLPHDSRQSMKHYFQEIQRIAIQLSRSIKEMEECEAVKLFIFREMSSETSLCLTRLQTNINYSLSSIYTPTTQQTQLRLQ